MKSWRTISDKEFLERLEQFSNHIEFNPEFSQQVRFWLDNDFIIYPDNVFGKYLLSASDVAKILDIPSAKFRTVLIKTREIVLKGKTRPSFESHYKHNLYSDYYYPSDVLDFRKLIDANPLLSAYCEKGVRESVLQDNHLQQSKKRKSPYDCWTPGLSLTPQEQFDCITAVGFDTNYETTRITESKLYGQDKHGDFKATWFDVSKNFCETVEEDRDQLKGVRITRTA